MADDAALEYPPKKKIKTSDEQDTQQLSTSISTKEAEEEQSRKERAVGIDCFVSEHAGFQGVLKRRYHDFIVNEIMPNGKVVHLDDPAKLKPSSVLVGAGNDEKKTDAPISVQDSSGGDLNSSTKAHDSVNPSSKDDNNPEVNSQPKADSVVANVEKKQDTKTPIELQPQDLEQLRKFFDADALEKLETLFHDISKALHQNKEAYGFVDSRSIWDKHDRKAAHQIVRKAFLGRIESAHQDGKIVRCSAAASAILRKGKAGSKKQKGPSHQSIGWNKLGGDYMHFTLYKENRDGGEVLGYLARCLKLNGTKAFDIAGNKDRRAATTQRISAYKIHADRFLGLNSIINQARVGDCSYSRDKLQLGDLAGNEFVITLRDCVVRTPGSTSAMQDSGEIEQHVRQSLQFLRDRGFINYYGLQRFGSFATRTDVVGQHMIRGDFKAAVDAILEIAPQSLEAAQTDKPDELVSADDRKRAQATHWFLTDTASTEDILDMLPRRFTSEYAIVSFLSKRKDQATHRYRGALEAIPRNTRSLYPHAYQSLIWNLAASHRWRLAPGKLLPGDLVISDNTPSNPDTQITYDAQGDPIYPTSVGQSDSTNVHIVTEQDIANNTYSIFDVVLPQPGHKILYPFFMLPFYRQAMQEHGGLDPENMQRNWRDVSLPGDYRKLLGRPAEDWATEVIWYDEPDAKIAVTDLEIVAWKEQQQGKEQDKVVQKSEASGDSAPLAVRISPTSKIALAADIVAGPRLAILLRFQLLSSTYATMALRELLKTGPIEYKPEFSSGRGI